ncbi:hypothetical protein KY290_013642 [Solanum tuberosum]|uniref:Non-LTR retroelement reverse transcriptase n=1 Tax=Solanum tuberosum TaxID=4113 RepID=A0ABQ7VMC3_SOLTU|nr:hypothetical protein KY290_013642 [Solanum tuberosum]
MAANLQDRWGVTGDFNMIINREEKIGGRPHMMEESIDFIECLNECGLQDTGFTGSKVTWCDNRDPPNTIWKRLDRLVFNTNWFDAHNNTSITHLSRSCSDHAHLLLNLLHENIQGIKYFKFLNFWTEHPNFLTTVHNSWDVHIHEPKRLETLIRELEDTCLTNNTPENRCELSKCKAKFIRYFKIQDSILSQKARVKWFNEGDANIAYFHATIKDRRRSLTIRRIRDENNNWLEGNETIAKGAVNFYQNLFSHEPSASDYSALGCIKSCISNDDNNMINAIPSLQEVIDIVFSIDANSSPGPDGLSGMYYDKCWNIISSDVHNAVKALFRGPILTKFHTHLHCHGPQNRSPPKLFKPQTHYVTTRFLKS